DLRAATAEVDSAAKSRLDARGAVEKPRKLGERDRSLVIEGARRMTFTQELRSWRDGLLSCGGGLAQIDPLSGPSRAHRRRRSHDARIRIDSAQRIGVSAFRAARVEQEIVKVPENEVVVALGRPQPTVASRVDAEQDLAIHQQGEELNPGKAVLP